MKKAVAIAVVNRNPFLVAWVSARNFGHLALDFMYGTPERARLTQAFALALWLLGYSLMPNGHGPSFVSCGK